VLAIGQRGNPRWLQVQGEASERVHHRLYSPKAHQGERIVVVGGGNSAAEAALSLAGQNQVTLVHRGDSLSRLFKENRNQIDVAVARDELTLRSQAQVTDFGDTDCGLLVTDGGKQRPHRIPYDRAFVLIGAEFPGAFLKQLGLKLENDWTGGVSGVLALVVAALLGLWAFGGQSGMPSLEGLGVAGGLLALGAVLGLGWQGWRGNRYAWLGLTFLVSYTIYGAKLGAGQEFWPFRGWGYEALSVLNRPWAFWYTVLYTAVMTVFGVQAMKRWGFDRNDRFQIWRYTSLLGFQWVFFFLIPEFLFQLAVRYQWVGERLATDPSFAENAWRSYGIVYAWPLFFYTFFHNPHQIWMVWGAVLAFGFIPLLVLFHGKRYCSWICGCGGLAETLGDRWRHPCSEGRRLHPLGTHALLGARHRRRSYSHDGEPRRPVLLPAARANRHGMVPPGRRRVAGRDHPHRAISVLRRQDVVPLLVPTRQHDASLQPRLHALPAEPLCDSLERPLYRLR
jgi:NosR/NirI family transcriptional regulator, nitrous oxide reductase regulator